MKKRNRSEKLNPYEEVLCDECGKIVNRESLTDVGTRKLCEDCFNEVPFQCCLCHRMLTRNQTSFWAVKNGMCCDECYEINPSKT